MRKTKIFIPIIGMCLACPVSYGHDVIWCDPAIDEDGVMIDGTCWTTAMIKAHKGIECWRVFNTSASVWYGMYDGGGIYGLDSCYISLSEGYALDTDYVFDEDRSEDSIFPCDGGSYCPGGDLTYSDVMAEMGNTMAFGYYCPTEINGVYTNKTLTSKPSVNSDSLAASKTDCYLESGTYYDKTGTFEMVSDCHYKE